MRLADLESAVNQLIRNQNELLKRIEVLEHAHETNIDSDNGNNDRESELPENGLNPSEPG